jgi:hypothetical protein
VTQKQGPNKEVWNQQEEVDPSIFRPDHPFPNAIYFGSNEDGSSFYLNKGTQEIISQAEAYTITATANVEEVSLWHEADSENW